MSNSDKQQIKICFMLVPVSRMVIMVSVKLSGELMQEIHQILHWNELVLKISLLFILRLIKQEYFLSYPVYRFVKMTKMGLISCLKIENRLKMVFKLCKKLKIDFLRRISCHGRNRSHTRCEYSQTTFLCYYHYSEYSLLGSEFLTNLLLAASKCHVTIQRHW